MFPRLLCPWFLLATLIGCQPPQASDPSKSDGLPGVDTSALTRTEHEIYSELVSEQLAPCTNVPSSLAQCVKSQAPCAACKPAAKLLAKVVQRGKSKEQAAAIYQARFAESRKVSIDLAGSPVKGNADAPITLVEWADFECAYCGRAAPVIEEQYERLGGKLRVVFKHFPIAAHKQAETLAKLAIAIQNQGKFWDAYPLLFAGSAGNLSDTAIASLAERLKLDAQKLQEDMKSPATQERLKLERAQADQLGLKGTPFIFVNNRFFDLKNFDLEEDLPSWLDAELELAGAK